MRAFVLALFSKIFRRQEQSVVRAPLIVTCDPVPFEALGLLIRTLEDFGAVVLRNHLCDGDRPALAWGSVRSSAGTLAWRHKGQTLIVTVTEDRGHFPRAMLIGGIKQTVYEAVELHNVQRANGNTLNPSVTAERSANT